MIHTLGNIVVTFGAIAATTFCIIYQFTATWWKSEAGRHLMAFTAMMATIMGYVSVRSIVADTPPVMSPELEMIRLVIFSLITTMLSWRCVLLGKYQIWAPWRRGARVSNRGTRARSWGRLRRNRSARGPRGA